MAVVSAVAGETFLLGEPTTDEEEGFSFVSAVLLCLVWVLRLAVWTTNSEGSTLDSPLLGTASLPGVFLKLKKRLRLSQTEFPGLTGV